MKFDATANWRVSKQTRRTCPAQSQAGGNCSALLSKGQGSGPHRLKDTEMSMLIDRHAGITNIYVSGFNRQKNSSSPPHMAHADLCGPRNAAQHSFADACGWHHLVARHNVLPPSGENTLPATRWGSGKAKRTALHLTSDTSKTEADVATKPCKPLPLFIPHFLNKGVFEVLIDRPSMTLE